MGIYRSMYDCIVTWAGWGASVLMMCMEGCGCSGCIAIYILAGLGPFVVRSVIMLSCIQICRSMCELI